MADIEDAAEEMEKAMRVIARLEATYFHNLVEFGMGDTVACELVKQFSMQMWQRLWQNANDIPSK
jgi:hypothetical protein